MNWESSVTMLSGHRLGNWIQYLAVARCFLFPIIFKLLLGSIQLSIQWVLWDLPLEVK
jgi:hypothetical protein